MLPLQLPALPLLALGPLVAVAVVALRSLGRGRCNEGGSDLRCAVGRRESSLASFAPSAIAILRVSENNHKEEGSAAEAMTAPIVVAAAAAAAVYSCDTLIAVHTPPRRRPYQTIVKILHLQIATQLQSDTRSFTATAVAARLKTSDHSWNGN